MNSSDAIIVGGTPEASHEDTISSPQKNKGKKKLSCQKLRRYDSLDIESSKFDSHHGNAARGAKWSVILHLAFQSIGVVYGDIGTSPLYVYSSTFTNGIKHNDDVLGVLSLILYTITLIPLLKYVFVVLRANDNGDGRDAPPTHYSFKIQQFSLLSKASIEKYTSDKFEVGDYKWKLSIYPSGNKERGGKGHISISLTLVDTTLLPAGWEVKAIFNLFVLDQVRDKYFCLPGKVRRFHAMKTEWDVANFINLDVFTDPSNGYLINDTCVFGADIFFQTRKGECLSILEEPATGSHTLKRKYFSALTLDRYESDTFTVGDHKWRIQVYPCGNGEGKGNSISVFLCLDESTLPPQTKLYVKFVLRLISQNQTKSEHFEFKADNHFGTSCLIWGSPKFMSLAKLNDPNKGFLVDDICTIEARVTLLGTVATAS